MHIMACSSQEMGGSSWASVHACSARACSQLKGACLVHGGAQLRLVCQFENTLDVTVLPPYVPSQAEREDPKLYAKNVQKLYAETLSVPIVDQVRGCM